MGTTRPNQASPPTSSSCAACTRTRTGTRELEVVRATRSHLREAQLRCGRYKAVVSILFLAGFLSPPEDEDRRGPTPWEKVLRAVRSSSPGRSGADVDPARDVHDHDVMGVRERRMPLRQRVTTRYAEEGEDIATAIAGADRKADGNRALTIARGTLVLPRSRSRSRSSSPRWPAARGRSASTSRKRSGQSSPSH